MVTKKTYNTPHREYIVKTRLTGEERREFEEKCRTLSLSQSEYLRQAIFYGKVSATIKVTAGSEEMLTAVSDLVAQYGKIGSNLNQMQKAFSYVEHWEQVKAGNYGLILWGKVGMGKSYFAGCIANALMEKEISVCMTNFALILNDLAASYKDRNKYIARLCSFHLLILDDFGMERGTEYGLEQVYSVIDSRYRSGRPLIYRTSFRGRWKLRQTLKSL